VSYRRVQLLLTPEQHRTLKRLARQRRKSISALVREIIARELQQENEDWIERTRRVTQDMLAKRGGKPIAVDAVELIRGLREERSDAIAPWATTHRD